MKLNEFVNEIANGKEVKTNTELEQAVVVALKGINAVAEQKIENESVYKKTKNTTVEKNNNVFTFRVNNKSKENEVLRMEVREGYFNASLLTNQEKTL